MVLSCFFWSKIEEIIREMHIGVKDINGNG